jgi:son of sevenless-like protein
MRPLLSSQLPISPAPQHLFTPKAPSISSVTCESDASSQSGSLEPVIFSALCMFDFTSSEAGLLSFRKNEILDIVKCTDGWWAAMKKGGTILGWIPQTFVTRLTQEMAEKLQDIREELRGAELKRIEELHYSTRNTTSLSVVNGGSAAPLSPILESKNPLKVPVRFHPIFI